MRRHPDPHRRRRTATPPSSSPTAQIDPRKVTKPVAGHFKAANVTPRRHLVELRTDAIEGYEIGQELGADVFDAGASVDVTGTTKGKGTAGVMKRHGFHGLGAGHGTQRKHRAPGSIGACATPGRVFKGMRMAGRMGHERQTTQACASQGRHRARAAAHQGRDPRPQGGLVLVRTAAKGA